MTAQKEKQILNTRKIRKFKRETQGRSLQMLTCYDFQTAQMLDQTDLDMILVGDSLGNVILGYDNTVKVTLEEMKIFSKAVKKGAKRTFVVADLPFGTYATKSCALKNAINLFQNSNVEALKLEGGSDFHCKVIKSLTNVGIPIMGHIGLTPQSVHEQGGYYTHGKTQEDKDALMQSALKLQEAGCFALVLECVETSLGQDLTQKLSIPTIGIGSGKKTDGQVLVINDLLNMGANSPPKFCTPISNLFSEKKKMISHYLESYES